jgi:hypothetical protein
LTCWAILTGIGFDEWVQFWICHVTARVATTVPSSAASKTIKCAFPTRQRQPCTATQCSFEATVGKYWKKEEEKAMGVSEEKSSERTNNRHKRVEWTYFDA